MTFRPGLFAALLLLAPLARPQAVLGTVAGSVPFDNVGMRVAMLGDVNGDGRDDLAVGSGGGGSEPGVVTVRSGADLSVLYAVVGAHANDKASAVARLGDIDGDGVGELAVGAWGDDTAGSESGSVTILSGAAGGVLHKLLGPYSSARFGWSVASAGDIDGDGLDDIIVGAPGNGMPAHVTVHSSATWSLLLDLPGDGTTLGLGMVVTSIGDLDGDGLRDVVVGCEDSDRVRVFSSADGTVLQQLDGPPGSKFGRTVATAGDLDGDGLDDLAVGAPEHDSSGLPAAGANCGLVQVHSGADGGLVFAHLGTGGVQMGRAVTAGGDIDGDGVPDVVASAPFRPWNNPALASGVVEALDGTDGKVLGTLGGSESSSGLGLVLSGGGDLNGDGHPDVAIGSPSDDVPVQDAGLLTCASFRFRVLDAYPDRLLFTQPGHVTLFGGGFDSGSPITITVGGQPASGVTWVSDGLVGFDAPIGAEDTQAELVYTQDGLSVVVPKAFAYEGVRLIDTTPDHSPMAGNATITLWGEHFVNDGSTVVTFLDEVGIVTSVQPPNRIDVKTPPYTPPALEWEIQVACSNGSFGYNGFVYASQFTLPERGNITGGLPVTIFGIPGHLAQNITVTMGVGGPPCQVVSVIGKQINLITPPIPEATGLKTTFLVIDPVAGNETVSNQFLYTPWMDVSYDANGFHGGTLNLRWITDPAVPGTQLITLWLGIPMGPSVSKALPGYAGLLHELPFTFVFLGLPEPPQPQVMHLHVPPLDPSVSGLHLKFQSLVSGEGGPKGTFTNADEIVLP